MLTIQVLSITGLGNKVLRHYSVLGKAWDVSLMPTCYLFIYFHNHSCYLILQLICYLCDLTLNLPAFCTWFIDLLNLFLLYKLMSNWFCFQNLIYEIIAGLRNVSTDAASSSSIPPSIATMKSVGELLSDIAPVATVNIQICHH